MPTFCVFSNAIGLGTFAEVPRGRVVLVPPPYAAGLSTFVTLSKLYLKRWSMDRGWSSTGSNKSQLYAVNATGRSNTRESEMIVSLFQIDVFSYMRAYKKPTWSIHLYSYLGNVCACVVSACNGIEAYHFLALAHLIRKSISIVIYHF